MLSTVRKLACPRQQCHVSRFGVAVSEGTAVHGMGGEEESREWMKGEWEQMEPGKT